MQMSTAPCGAPAGRHPGGHAARAEPLLAEHRGRLFKLRGDGLLVAFGSVVDAVGRTLSIQRALAAHEAGAAEPLRLRIGVNLGDVVESEAGGLFGEGVIIAARLQALAEPAGILASGTGTVFDHLQGQLDCGLEVLGERRLENIDRPPGLSADDRRCRASTRAGRHGARPAAGGRAAVRQSER